MKKQNIKTIAKYFSLVLLGMVLITVPKIVKSFKTYARKAKTSEAKLWLQCASRNPECVPVGPNHIQKPIVLCPKITCFENPKYYDSINKMHLPTGEQVVVIWGNLDKQENLNFDMWAMLDKGPNQFQLFHCIDGTDTNNSRVSNDKTCELLKLNASIQFKP
jgi:hypothetical protein